MKILGIILAVLMLAGSAFVGLAGANKARDAAHTLSALTEGMSDAEKAMLDKHSSEMSIPSTGRLNAGALVGLVGALAGGALLVMTFAKKHLVPKLAVAAVGITALSAAVYPHVPTGPLDGMAPRTQAIVAAVLALIGAGGAMLAARKTA